MTLRQFSRRPPTVPATTAWYLADLGEARGRQDLWIKQYPQRLRILREHAIVESAVASNRIEGVTVDQKRVGTIVFGNRPLRDRNEEEVRGYRDALKLVHQRGATLPVSEETIQELHRLSRPGSGDAGRYRETAMDIVEVHADGRRRVRFTAVAAQDVSAAMAELLRLWDDCLAERPVYPLVALAGSNLDFLCIHPFRDGNGRVSRLLWLLQCYHLGYEVGRYISLERLVEENRERYYETLEQSSAGWHEGKQDPWQYVNYCLYVLKSAYGELEARVGQTASPRGEKTALILAAIDRATGPFRVGSLQQACPGVSVDLIRRTLKRLRSEGRVECLGRGQHAEWRKTPARESSNTSFNG
jgi:Fic family protein